MIINENTYLSITKEWHLRVDGIYGTLFYYDADSLVYHQLPKEKLTALLLMDGKTTLGKIKKIMQYFYDNFSENEIEKIIESVVKISSDKNNPSTVLKATDSPTESHPYDIKKILQQIINATPQDIENVLKGRLTSPLNLTLMPSNDCATDCIYCYAERKPINHKDYLPLERWLELVDECYELGSELAVFSGGDPMTYPHIMKILERMIQKGFHFTLPTKTLITKEIASKMALIGMNKVWCQISCDGYSSDTLKKMVGVDNYDKRAFESIENLLAENLNVRVNIVLTPINYHESFDLARKLNAMGVQKVGFAGYGRSHYRHKDELFLTDKLISLINDRVDELKLELKGTHITNSVGKRDFSSATFDKKSEKWKERAKCSGGRSSLVITPAGDVTLCEQIPLDQIYIVGNVKNQSIKEIWNSEKMWQMVNMPSEKFKGTICEKCASFDECQTVYGHCFRDALFTYGTIYTAPPACPKAPVGLRMQ